MKEPNQITLKPAMSYAVSQAAPWLGAAILLSIFAWLITPSFMLFAIPVAGYGCYRILYVRSFAYRIDLEHITCSKGLLLKKSKKLELWRLKDYSLTTSSLTPIFRYYDLELTTEGPEQMKVIMNGIIQEDLLERLGSFIQAARISRENTELIIPERLC